MSRTDDGPTEAERVEMLLEHRIEELETEVADLKHSAEQRVASLEHRVDRLLGRVLGLERELADVRGDVRDLERGRS